MTKRFTLKYINEQHISANLYDNGTFIGSIGIGEELILEVLNYLSKENGELKQKVDFYKYFQKDARELEKENEQLKNEIERITKEKENWAFISDCSVQVMNEEEKFKEDYLRIATNDLKRLQEENEQLKKQLDDCREYNEKQYANYAKNNSQFVKELRGWEKSYDELKKENEQLKKEYNVEQGFKVYY